MPSIRKTNVSPETLEAVKAEQAAKPAKKPAKKTAAKPKGRNQSARKVLSGATESSKKRFAAAARERKKRGDYKGGGNRLPDILPTDKIKVLNRPGLNASSKGEKIKTGDTVETAIKVRMKQYHGRRNFLRLLMRKGIIELQSQ